MARRRRPAPTRRACGSATSFSRQGWAPSTRETRQVVGDTIEEQTELTIDNLSAVLEAAGTSLDHAVKATVHLQDLGDFAAFNRVYERRFGDPKPVRTTVGSNLLGIMVEIDLVAVGSLLNPTRLRNWNT